MRKVLTKIFKRAQWANANASKNLEKAFAKDKACYVLITCGEPSEDGKMQVEMTYEGDACLAAYLIESAQGFIDEQTNFS